MTALPWKYLGLGLAALLLIAAVYFAVDAYGDARYDAGVSDTDAKWHEAAEELKRQSQEAAAGADEGAAEREAEFAEKLATEKQRLEETVAKGGDPFDVLFGDE